jgi:arylsulfatase
MGGHHDFDDDRWSLFDLGADFSEAHDVADRHPERLERMVELWWAEAGRNQVLPLDDSLIQRVGALEPPRYGPRLRAVIRPGGGPVSEDAIPMLIGGFRLRARLDVPPRGAQGVVCALGDWSNGWALYLLGGRPVVTFNLFGTPYRTAGPDPLTSGARDLTVEYRRARAGGGTVAVAVDGAAVAEGTVGQDLPFRWQIGAAGLLVGHDRGFPVCDDYEPPFPCTATIERIIIELPHAPPPPAAEEVAAALRHE